MLVTTEPSRIRIEIEDEVEAVTRFILLKSLTNLTAPPQDGGTPVKTGFASASWICSVGVPSSQVAGSRDDVDYGPQEAGRSTLLGYKLSDGAAFLVNNVWYVGQRLNYGSSKQARQGFVESAFQRAINEADRVFR